MGTSSCWWCEQHKVNATVDCEQAVISLIETRALERSANVLGHAGAAATSCVDRCRGSRGRRGDILSNGARPITAIGPLLEDEAAQSHEGYWR
jgi:hypothetical protein